MNSPAQIFLGNGLPFVQLFRIRTSFLRQPCGCSISHPIGLTGSQLSLGEFRVAFWNFFEPISRLDRLFSRRVETTQDHSSFVGFLAFRPAVDDQIGRMNDQPHVFQLLVRFDFDLVISLNKGCHRHVRGFDGRATLFV